MTRSASVPVVVVGAGLAGLHAAWRLSSAGIPVVVLEARERVGGRTWSHRLDDGTVVERGGEFIAPTDDALRGLCAELDLELVPHGFSFDRRPTPDRPAPTEDELAAIMAAARARTAARLAAGDADVAASEVLTPPAERQPAEVSAARRLETSLTVPLSRVSARRLFGGEEHGYDPADRVRAGNQEVARELARRLGDKVRLRMPVVGIRHDAGGAWVRCRHGERLDAAAVVIAVPLPLLLALDLEPGLPAAVRSAAERALFGDAAKLHVPLLGAPQPGRMASPTALWWCWTSRAAGRRDAAPVLSAFAGGAEAVIRVGARDGAAAWAAQAVALRPDVEPAEPCLVTHWAAEPWTRGSYVSHAVGSAHADDAAWATPWGSAVLAGEHTAGSLAGTMNGAVASGARAARTVASLLDLGWQPPG